MFKQVAPDDSTVRNHIGQFPHCDSRVLHAPGECDYCDRHPEWQALRFAWRIAFTGYEPDTDQKELPDPATHARSFESLNAWEGNQAHKETECQSK